MNRRLSIPSGRRTLLAASASLLSLWAGGCAQGDSPDSDSSQAGTLLELPAAAQHDDGFDFYVGDENQGGSGSTLKIKGVFWGRLVDVYAVVPGSETRQKILRDFLIDPALQTDIQDYRLELNPVTLREELTIRHAFGTPLFEASLKPLLNDEGLQPVQPKGIGPGELPPFTAVARNSAMLVVFDDLLDVETITRDNVLVEVGYPPTAPFEPRIVPDRSHGKVLDETFHTTRVLIDFSVSESEAQSQGIPANGLGLPGATTLQSPNAVIRVPTKITPSAAQFGILQNLSGHGLSFIGNGPVDGSSPTQDVVRGFRSGGRTSVTQDPYEGFLQDDTAPHVMGSQRVTIQLSATQPSEPELFRLDLGFVTAVCGSAPKEGDLVQVANGVMRVLVDSGPLVGATALNVLVERADDEFDPDEPPRQGVGEFRTPWDPDAGLLPACFLRFTPEPANPPADGVSTSATIAVAFSEPMNPERTEAFDGIQVLDPSVPLSNPLGRTVVGVVAASPSLTNHVFQASLPFKHTTGANETFEYTIQSSFNPANNQSQGVTDLAGNPIADLLPSVPFTLDPAEATLDTGSVALRFNSVDENGDEKPEIRGQIVPDYSRGVIVPRGMVRFSGFADTTNSSSAPVLAMTPVGGVVEPLSIYGSRLMTLWRYHDLNLPFEDDQYYNIDVEGLAWMVSGSGVQLDLFPEFQLSVAHSRFLPDEYVAPATMTAPPSLVYPNSGVVPNFEQNLVDTNEDPLTTLAPKSGGYPIQPLDSFKTPSGTLMQPFPINLNKPISQFTYWTWRDTAKLAVGGPNGGGVETRVIQGPPPPAFVTHYATGLVPTIGLPLLMDFRTYPSPTTTQGLNFLQLAGVNIAPGTPSPGLPFFRAHSTGGVLPNSQLKLIEPDSEQTAQGGLNAAGAPTPPTDSGFYYGNADFVARVNRMHTIWFDTGSPSSFAELVTIPRTTETPAGTSMSFDFRGAVAITGITAAQDGSNLDAYGDPHPLGTSFGVNFLNGDKSWKQSLTELSGARYIQVRMTMITSAETGAAPELDALGLSFFKE
jgi:hypothetical protein